MDRILYDVNAQQNAAEERIGIEAEFSQAATSKETLQRSMLKVLELLAGISQLCRKAKENAESIPSNTERKVFAEAVKHILSLIVDQDLSDSLDNMALKELVSAFPISPSPYYPTMEEIGHWLPIHWCSALQNKEITNEDVSSILHSNKNMGIDGGYGHRHRPSRVVRTNSEHRTTPYTPMHFMAMQKHPDLNRFRLLLNDSSMKENRQETYWDETTAIINRGNEQGLEVVLGYGPGLELGMYRHCHPLHVAVQHTESMEVVEMLLSMVLEDELVLLQRLIDSNHFVLAQYLHDTSYTSVTKLISATDNYLCTPVPSPIGFIPLEGLCCADRVIRQRTDWITSTPFSFPFDEMFDRLVAADSSVGTIGYTMKRVVEHYYDGNEEHPEWVMFILKKLLSANVAAVGGYSITDGTGGIIGQTLSTDFVQSIGRNLTISGVPHIGTHPLVDPPFVTNPYPSTQPDPYALPSVVAEVVGEEEVVGESTGTNLLHMTLNMNRTEKSLHTTSSSSSPSLSSTSHVQNDSFRQILINSNDKHLHNTIDDTSTINFPYDWINLILQQHPHLARKHDVLGSLPIHYAAAKYDKDTIDRLLSVYPASLYMKTPLERNLLHQVCFDEWNPPSVVTEKIRYLCRQCPTLTKERERMGNTPLHIALDCSVMRYDVVKTLCDVDPETVGDRIVCRDNHMNEWHQSTALHVLIRRQTLENELSEAADCFRLLLRLHPLSAAQQDLRGLVPYIHAAAKGLKPYFLRCILQAERTISRVRELTLFRLNYEARRMLLFLIYKAMGKDKKPTLWTKLKASTRDLLILVASYL